MQRTFNSDICSGDTTPVFQATDIWTSGIWTVSRRFGNCTYAEVQWKPCDGALGDRVISHGFWPPCNPALLTHGAEPFWRSRQFCSYSRISQHFMEPKGSLPCSQEPSTGPYPEPDILLNTLFSNTLSLCSSLNLRDQVSRPCRTAGKIIVLYILIFMFLDSRRENTR
jgi:hypothetical protein